MAQLKTFTIECRKPTESAFREVKAESLFEAKKTANKVFGKAHGLHIYLHGEHAAYRFAGMRRWFETGIAA